MIFALERNALALRLLRLEKSAAGYHIAYQQQWLLTNKARAGASASDGHLLEVMQQMRSQLPATASVVIAIHDADLILACVRLEKNLTMAAIIHQCQMMLKPRLSEALHHYSWDIHVNQNAMGYGLCVAYPLQKIAFLQDLCALSHLKPQVIEPSICALARFSLQLLALSQALLLLYENNHYTLCLTVNGDIIALEQFQDPLMLDVYCEKFIANPILAAHMEKISEIFLCQEMAAYPQELLMHKTRMPLQEMAQTPWAICMGLALRTHEAS